uniref:Ig-like domain-containing protein n=1 Tax=Gouania willdenowi TaxID=441366 RepID=A0A8C5G7A8_GOUWI
LEAQKIQVVPEVTEYVGSDVTLLCQFTLTPEKANVTQVQWDLTQPGGAKFVIVVIHDVFENAFHESPLKDRVDVSKHSLIIKDVTKEDSGLYTCTFIVGITLLLGHPIWSRFNTFGPSVAQKIVIGNRTSHLGYVATF